MMNVSDRARAILIAGHAMKMTDEQIFNVAYDFLDLDVHPMSDLEVTIRGLFQGDDDFDDMIHELDHALGKCADDSPECPWNDDDESPEQTAFYAAEAARGELAGSPDTMTCYACGGFNGHSGPEKKVVKLGRVIDRADPTQTYVLECGHTTIAM